jgi:hypothetical protein
MRRSILTGGPVPRSERALGDQWAETKRARGAWVQKLPASNLSGVPDWLLGYGLGIAFVEAKRRLEGSTAYHPRQLTRAQRFFLDQVARHSGDARVVVLGEEGFVEIRSPLYNHPLSAAEFERTEVRFSE